MANTRPQSQVVSAVVPKRRLAQCGEESNKWQPPEYGSFKLNTDAAWTINNAGIGVILRDHEVKS